MEILEERFTFHTALPIIVPLSGGTSINPSIKIILGGIEEYLADCLADCILILRELLLIRIKHSIVQRNPKMVEFEAVLFLW